MVRKLLLSLFIIFPLLSGCITEADRLANQFFTVTPSPEATPLPSPTPRLLATQEMAPDPIQTATPPPPQTVLPATSPPTQEALPPTPTTGPAVVSLLFTGQIVPGRCVQAAVEQEGNADFLYEDIREIVQNADISIGTLNAAISDYPPSTGCVETFVLVGESSHADAMASAGFDLMSVASNHIKNCGLTNCGDRAFLDTLANLDRVGIQPVGGGENLEKALEPVVVELRGTRIAFISLGQIEPLAFAGEDSPGIAVLNEENLRAAVQAAKAQADVVVVLPHWGPEYSHFPNPSQKKLARVAVEAGADLVVGNHTHYLQGFEEINGVPVFYGLGNFIFDQTQERARQQSMILRVLLVGSEVVTYEIIPTVSDRRGKVFIASQEEAVEILTLLQNISAEIRE
jgi:poly-gamma-glutamate synthesis protein (capsule biosynthesis protein)